jgi:hypothetical protein
MRHLQELPASPQTVALYMTDRASSLASGTITRRLTSITKAHQSSGFTDSPASTHHFIVGETLKGIRRTIGTAQKGKDPLLAVDIRAIVAASAEGLHGSRDRALVLVGFAGAFRRSELARINVSDLSFNIDGVVIDVRVSKTDQERAGRKVGLPFGQCPETCPVWRFVPGLQSLKSRKVRCSEKLADMAMCRTEDLTVTQSASSLNALRPAPTCASGLWAGIACAPAT